MFAATSVFVAMVAGLLLVAPQNTEAVSNNGLLGYWSFDEGTGNVAGDFSGNNYYGTTTGSVSWTAGKQRSALNFSSPSGVGINAPTTVLDAPTSMTVAAWFKTTSGGPCENMVSKIRDNTNDTGWIFGHDLTCATPGTIAFIIQLDGSNYNGKYTSSGIYNDGIWHHAVATLSGGCTGTITIYIDGVAVPATDHDAGTVSACSNTEQIRIGKSGLAQHWNGSLDEVRIYNRALSAAEVLELYQAGLVLKKPPNNLGLLGYWSFNEGTGNKAGDFSGNGKHGTLTSETVGVPTWVNGKRGKALSFDGGNDTDYVSTTFNQTLLPATFVAWVKVSASDLVACDGIVFSRGTNVSGINVGACTSSTRLGYHWNEASNTFDWAGGPTIPTGKWFLAALVVESGQATAYAYSPDGLNSAVNAVAHTSSVIDNLQFGRDSDDPDHNRDFAGQIDEVRVYNRALSASEVKALYESGAVKFASSVDLQKGSTLGNGLVAHWTFDGANFTNNVADMSGSGNHGRLVSGLATSTVKKAGKLGQGAYLPGTINTPIVGPDINATDGASQLSFSFWVRADDAADDYSVISKMGGGGWQVGFKLDECGSGGVNDISFTPDNTSTYGCTGNYIRP